MLKIARLFKIPAFENDKSNSEFVRFSINNDGKESIKKQRKSKKLFESQKLTK